VSRDDQTVPVRNEGVGELGTIKEASKVLNSSEDIHVSNMSAFEMDEHLQGTRVQTPPLLPRRPLQGAGVGRTLEALE
jgi:hypothetical protein